MNAFKQEFYMQARLFGILIIQHKLSKKKTETQAENYSCKYADLQYATVWQGYKDGRINDKDRKQREQDEL